MVRPSCDIVISWVEPGMSRLPVMASVAASKKCTLLALFAVTIRFGPPGRLLRSITSRSLRSGDRGVHLRSVEELVELDRLACFEAPGIRFRRRDHLAGLLVAPRAIAKHDDA